MHNIIYCTALLNTQFWPVSYNKQTIVMDVMDAVRITHSGGLSRSNKNIFKSLSYVKLSPLTLHYSLHTCLTEHIHAALRFVHHLQIHASMHTQNKA